MKTEIITLEQMLDARERRAYIQNNMLEEDGGGCLVCLTMNIAGGIKRTPMTRLLFSEGIAVFEALGLETPGSRVIDEPTGNEAFWLVREDPCYVKKLLEAAEEQFPAARLFDFDVLVKDPSAAGGRPGAVRKLSRAVGRKCLICGRPAAGCARSRRHGLDAVKRAEDGLLKQFSAEAVGKAAYESLLDELNTTPKPGLVDMASNGAHADMDPELFGKSAESLKTYFRDAAAMGMNGCRMEDLKIRGLAAEKEMFTATGGVNTHKGLIYSLGLMTASMGRVLAHACLDSEGPAETSAEDVAFFAAELAAEDAERRIRESLDRPETNGAAARIEYGAGGAVREAAGGFRNAVYCASRLRYYTEQAAGSAAADENSARQVRLRAGALAFCDCMAGLEDTNLLHRGGREGLLFAQSEAARISALMDPEERIRELSALDDEMIKRNLSPGGSADMLALAYFLDWCTHVLED